MTGLVKVDVELIEKFNRLHEKQNNVYFYFNFPLWNRWEIRHSDTERKKRYVNIIHPLEELLRQKLDYKLWESNHTLFYPDCYFNEALEKAIMKLELLKDAK